MKFKPLHDRVLIEVLDSSEKTAGGIIIPDSAQEKPQEGKVIAVGGGAKVYNGIEAARVVKDLNPKRVIPVQYVRGKPSRDCDQSGIQPFLDAMQGTETRKVGNTLYLRTKLPDKTVINLMR